MTFQSPFPRTLAALTLCAAAGCSDVATGPRSLQPGSALHAAAAPSGVQTVTPEDVHDGAEGVQYPGESWVKRTRAGGSGTFVTGPGTPPLGSGSFQMQTPGSGDKVYLFNYDHTGSSLASIAAMGYSTYRASGLGAQVPSINMEIDANGDAEGGYAVLVFEPVYNPTQGAVANGTWQTWDAYADGSAIWWSSRAIPGVCAFSCFVSWSTIVASNPDARLLSYGVNAGTGNPTLDAAVDALSIGFTGGPAVTYDFELTRVPRSTDECKGDGWRTVTRADGTPFRNQGQCVQYVNTGK